MDRDRCRLAPIHATTPTGLVDLLPGEAEDLVLAPAGVVGEVENVLPRGGQVGADGKVFGVLEEALEPHSSALRSSNVSYCIIAEFVTIWAVQLLMTARPAVSVAE